MVTDLLNARSGYCMRTRLFFVIVLGSLMFSLYSCKQDLKSGVKVLDKSLLNTERAEEVTIIYSKEGHTQAMLYTKSFNHIQNVIPSYIEMKKGLKVEFFDDSLHVQSTLTAKYGKYFESNGNVLVRDSVVVTNKKNERLNTEELVWNEKLQKFYTEKFVKISTPTQVIYGDGLESNQNFSVYKITNVKGIIGISKSALPE
ncbi:MAG: LPS export ABC transporter periplasmic protein LptC [Chitinophagaceae bacterium]|nr:LPS export ABC transporter periplasmic protein LptC [Chitinophagaceae bacterium]